MLFVLLAALAVGAGAQPPQATPKPLQAPPRPGDVEVTLFEGGEGLDFYSQAARQFTLQRPQWPVVLDGDPAMADQMRIRIMEGRYPEVSNANLDIWNLIGHDQILALDPWLDGPAWNGQGTWRESFLPGSLDQFRKNGKTYGVPLVYVVWSVYYDKRVFARHGWSPPRTWPELFALGEKMKANGMAPMAFQGRYPFYAKALVQHTYFQLAGQAAYDAQQALQPGSYDNAKMVEALGVLEKLAAEDLQKGSLGMSHTEAQLEFFQGRAAMLMCGSWLYSEMKDNIPEGFELGAFPLPLPDAPSADAGAVYATSGYWFVFKHSANPTGGVEFLRYLTSRGVAERFAAERGMTVAVSGANSQLHPMMADVAGQLAGVERTFGVSPGESVPGMDQVWTDTLAKLLAGGSYHAAQAAADMERGARAARQAYQASRPEGGQGSLSPATHLGKTVAFLGFLAVGLLLSVRRAGVVARPEGQARGADLTLFLGPSLFVYLVFFLIPSALAGLLALSRWDGVGEPRWVGLQNFSRLLLHSDGFWAAFSNNLFLMLVLPATVLPLSLLLANALHHGVWGSRVFRVAFFFPNLLGIAGVLLWQQLYNPAGGPVNVALVAGGLDQFQGFAWLSPDYLYWALVPMGIWGACGFNMVLFLAAMQGVPEDLYEAASLYGANAWQRFRYITLPMIWPTVVAAFLFMLIGGMKAFEAIWVLTGQSPTTENHVVGTLLVQSMFKEQAIGQAAALACLLFVTVLVGSLLAERVLNRDQD